MTRPSPALAIPLLLGCAKSVLPDYEAAKREALAAPAALPSNWKPDAVLHLSQDLVDAWLGAALDAHGTLTGTIDTGLAELTPKLTVRELALTRAPGCVDCLQVNATLEGRVGWSTVLGSGATDAEVTLAFDAVFEAAPRSDGVWVVRATPRRVRDLKVDIAGAALVDAKVPIRAWLDDALAQQIGPIALAELGSSDLPLLGARVVPSGRTVQVQLHTASPTPVAVPTDRVRPADDWQVTLSQDSLLDLARAATFRHGAVGYDVVPEPTTLRIDGNGFVLGLRLWRVRGRGWWRDYVVRGTVETKPRRVLLVPGTVEEGPRSPGAVWVDPLAALAEGVVLKTIEKALTTSLPASHEGVTENVAMTLEIATVSGNGTVLDASGSLRFEGTGAPGRR